MSYKQENTDRNLTVVQVAKMLHVVERTVTEWLHSRQLKGWKTGRQWLIPESSVGEYLKKVQPKGVEPPNSQLLQKAYAEVAHVQHISDLLCNLQQLRDSVDYLNGPDRYQLLANGAESEPRLPRFTRTIWRSIEQHLTGTSAWDALNVWKESAISVLDAERSVMQLSKDLGERKFGVPLLRTSPKTGGRLTTAFAAAGVSLATVSNDPEEALQNVHLEWQKGNLMFNYSYSVIVRTELNGDAAVEGFREVMTGVITSENGAALRDASKIQVEATARLEDALDGINVSSSVPGRCFWCSIN